MGRTYDPGVRTTNLVSPGGTAEWGGLAIDVDAPVRPGLRMEVATGRRMLLRQGDRPLLFARITEAYRGVRFLRAGGVRSPVSPCRADRARAWAERGPREALARWARAFAADLATATRAGYGPLHRGRWTLTCHEADAWRGQRRPPDGWLPLTGEHDGHINWFTTPCAWDVVPLRALSAPGGARVKAYRKQARDGTLPPVLLWWISGLACHVLLDGHDRLVAALAEEREPPVLVLGVRGDEQVVAAYQGWALRNHADASAHVDGQVAAGGSQARTGYVAVNRQLGEALNGIGRMPGRTRAWPHRGGRFGWQRQAEASDPDWARSVR